MTVKGIVFLLVNGAYLLILLGARSKLFFASFFFTTLRRFVAGSFEVALLGSLLFFKVS